jgi:hypothetical protein
MNRFAILAAAAVLAAPAIAQASLPPTPPEDFKVQPGQPCAVGHAHDPGLSLGELETDQWLIRKLSILLHKAIPRTSCPGAARTVQQQAAIHKAASDAVLKLAGGR